MCGPENTNRPRGGALVALNAPVSSSKEFLCGDLAFHVPGQPGSTDATHARLTPSETCDMSGLIDPYIVIQYVLNRSDSISLLICFSSSGDLTRDPCECGVFRRFAFPVAREVCNREYVEFALPRPLSLEVGNDGIIGRRVSLYSRPTIGRDVVVAEGIVGFNFLSQEPCSEVSSVPSSP